MSRRCLSALLLLVAATGPSFGQTFTPFDMPQGNTENRTGMWFCPDLGKAADVLPLKTRVWATKESVTGGVAMKVVFDKGSKGIVAYEKDTYPPGSAGLTLVAKASRPLTIKVGNIPAEVGVAWKKLDFPWEKLGTTRDKPRLGFQLGVAVQGPIEEKTWLILDRVGTEAPQFDAAAKLEPQVGPDATLSSKEILYGGEYLAKTRQRAQAKQPFKVIALGDSVTAGAQMVRGTWAVRGPDGVPFLYFAHLARLAEQHFGYQGITPLQFGHGGWTAAQALKVIDKEVVAEAGPHDLVILEFGANDLSWAKVPLADWKANMKKLIARARTKTDRILIMSPTPIGGIAKLQPEITRTLQELVQGGRSRHHQAGLLSGRAVRLGLARQRRASRLHGPHYDGRDDGAVAHRAAPQLSRVTTPRKFGPPPRSHPKCALISTRGITSWPASRPVWLCCCLPVRSFSQLSRPRNGAPGPPMMSAT